MSNYYMVDWVSKTEAQLTNEKGTIVVPIDRVEFTDFNKLSAKLRAS
jgi:hypothetical protein